MPKHRYPLKYLPVDALTPTPSNVNEMEAAAFDRLIQEITEGGVIESLSVVPIEDTKPQLYQIIGGEHRWRASKIAGEDEVPCLILDDKKWKDKDLQEFTMIRLNVLKGKVNQKKFLELYNRVAQKYGADEIQSLMGFMDKAAFDGLVHDTKKTLKQSVPPELHSAMEEELRSAKTVDDLAKIAEKFMTNYGETMDYSFLVFTHGGQEHIYVQMDTRMAKAMKSVLTYCQDNGVPINEIIAPAVEYALKKNKIECKEEDARNKKRDQS